MCASLLLFPLMKGMFSNPWVPASLTIYTGDSVKVGSTIATRQPFLPPFSRDGWYTILPIVDIIVSKMEVKMAVWFP